MKRLFLLFFGILAALGLYLFFWPVPVDPQVWDAPENPGYMGDYAPNARLVDLEGLDLGRFHGPEDIVFSGGSLFTAMQDGVVLRINPTNGKPQIFAETGGVPLGMEKDAQDNLIIADAHKGLLSVSADGTVTVLTDKLGDSPIRYADDLDIGDDGIIYFSDASTKFGAAEWGSTMQASKLEIMEMGRTGRILSFDPQTDKTSLISDKISFANGVAWAGVDEMGHGSVLVIETGKYRVLKIYVTGPRKGEHIIFLDNLPGFPDNINRGSDGTFWVGLVSQRSPFLDKYSNRPILRKMVMRLPESFQPDAVNYGFVFQIDGDGRVLQTLQDPSGAYPLTTGAIEGSDGYLYITSLGASSLGRMKYP